MLNPSAVGRISVPPPPPDRRELRTAERAARRKPDGANGVCSASLDSGGESRSPADLSFGAWLAAGLRGVMGISQDTCRLRPVSPTIQLVEHTNAERSRMAVHGVHTCKSPLCPLCAPKWARTRSDEITRAIDGRDWAGVFFASLTMRHNRRMPLSLQQRILTQAHGNLWSSNAGQKAAARLGGKPESVRAHDRTASFQRGWHPHIHSLLFVENAELSADELAALLDDRWPKVLRAALRRMKSLVKRILTRSSKLDDRDQPNFAGGCGRKDCRVCMAPYYGPREERVMFGPLRENESRVIKFARPLGAFPLPAAEQQGECFHFRERAQRLFGVRLVPRERRERSGVNADGSPRYERTPVPLVVSIQRVSDMLAKLTEASITPTRQRGVRVERMRDREALPGYLAKLGLELAWSLDKSGKPGSDGVLHFGHFQVAAIACTRESALVELAERVGTTPERLREWARRSYRQLFLATVGTQTITFSDREALGLGPDPYREGDEPAEPASDETSRVIGQIEAGAYTLRAEQRGHGVIGELAAAYERGELGALGYVDPPAGATARELRRSPSSERGPPGDVDPEGIDRDGYLIERPEGWTPGGALPLDARVIEVVDNGSVIGAAYRDAVALPSSVAVTPEQVRQRVREAIRGKTIAN